jgi:hypothetical protein
MKKITKPAEREESVFYSDFSGKNLGECGAPVDLKIICGYESKYDGCDVTLHLDDKDLEKLLACIKSLISEDYKCDIKKKLEKYEKDFEDSMQMRDWGSCDVLSNNLWFWRDLLGISENENI